MKVCAKLLLAALLVAGPVAASCLQWDVAGVTLNGNLTKQTFPGPPNYESIADGDAPEVYFILHLDRPICVSGKESLNGDVETTGVEDVQLVFLGAVPASVSSEVGKHVAVTGQLFLAQSGHHHTKVLFEVTPAAK
jgi:hypothetical protein